MADARVRTVVRAVAVAAFAWFAWPWAPATLRTGLDPSWIWAVNRLAEPGAPRFRHGAAVVYTYGPLGAWLVPAGAGGHLPGAIAARLLLFALSLALVALALRRAGTLAAATTAMLLCAALELRLTVEYRLVLALFLFLALRMTGGRPRLALPWAVAWTLLLALMKINLGIECVALVAVYLGWRLRGERAGLARELGWGTGVAVVGGAAALTLFGSWSAAATWLHGQAELARGFPLAMGVAGPPLELAAGLASLGLLSAGALIAWRRRSRLAPVGALALPLALLAFRHGFVRQDAHVVEFFPLIVALFALAVPLAGGGRPAHLAAAGGALAILIAAPTMATFRGWRPILPQPWRSLAEEVAWLRTPDAAARWAEEAGRHSLAGSVLPAELVAPLRGGTADAIPSELSRIPANGLRWVPTPTLQLLSAYTPWLDSLDAAHFAGPESPDGLLVDFVAASGRHPLWDAPLTWTEVLTRYEPARLAAGALLALRRTRPAELERRDLGGASVGLGEWLAVPDEEGLIFAALDVHPSAVGEGAQLLLRLPAVWVDCEMQPGYVMRYRIVPENARSGLLVSPLAERLRDLAALWRGEPGRRVRRLRVVTDGCDACFVSPVVVRFTGATLPPALTPP